MVSLSKIEMFIVINTKSIKRSNLQTYLIKVKGKYRISLKIENIISKLNSPKVLIIQVKCKILRQVLK